MDHSRLGGVTDGKFNVVHAVREKSDATIGKQDVLFANFLEQVWDPVGSGRSVPFPNDEAPTSNTTRGLLSWKTRALEYVCGPTVYSKTHWVARRLNTRELSDAADMPGVLFKSGSLGVKAELSKCLVPGKVLAQAIHLINWDSPPGICSNEGISKRPRFDVGELLESVTKEEIGRGRVSPNKRGGGEMELTSQRMGQKRQRVRFDVEVKETPPRAPLEAVEDAAMMTTTVSAKASKSDDARVPQHLWDARVVKNTAAEDKCETSAEGFVKVKRALGSLREGALTWWKRNVKHSFHVWYESTEHDSEEKDSIYAAGLAAIEYAEACDWWEWKGGSAIFFWRWPEEYQKEIREGVPPCFIGPPPATMTRQPPYKDETTRLLVAKKVGTVVDKGYIKIVDVPLLIRSLMYMFHVPKDLDIRMVYDGSKSGLNAVLFAPWFHIHTVDAMCRNLLPGYWCADNDYGEQFLNFALHEILQRYCGADLTQLQEESEGELKEVLGLWTRCAMGLRPSPYNAVKGALIARRLILGDRYDPENPFQWSHVRLNQPGDDDYDASLPWLMKIRVDGKLAASLLQYIDDMRTCAMDEATAWKVSSRIAKILAFLGLQDAARKRREPSQTPGAWGGGTVRTDEGSVCKSVTEDRWRKTQIKIREIGAQIGLSDDWSEKLLSDDELANSRITTLSDLINHKKLESSRGFLVYVSNTFPAMVPYLKGIHMTLDSWRSYRDDDGWKLSYRDRKLAFEVEEVVAIPKEVEAVPRLQSDLEVLMDFTSSKSPPRVPVRAAKSVALFIVGDASGSGFGGSTWSESSDAIRASFGGWEKEVTLKSSNFREAYNLVLLLEDAFELGTLGPGTEVFVFTDNSTAERAFNKGSSTNKSLHDLVVRIRSLQMQGQVIPHFVWISGERMIAQGTDGLSRGDLTCGVMNDGRFLKHVPLNQPAFSYNTTLREELMSWLPADRGEWILLTEEDWFDGVFKNSRGNFVWTPSACLARIAIEQLCEVKHVHPMTNHVFLAPALMTGEWRKLLGKQSDALLTLPVGPSCWNKKCYEPLVMSLTSSMLLHSPWIIKKTEWVGHWQKEMREVWQTTAAARRSSMRKFWLRARSGSGHLQ